MKILLHEDATRTNRMQVAIKKFKDNKGCGTFNHCPGFGKTQEALMILDNCIKSRNYSISPYTHFLIVVPSIVLIPMWQNEINVSFEDYKDKIHIKTIDSISNEFMDDLGFYLTIFDEIHKYLSDGNFEKISNINTVFKLGLSGTTPEENHRYYHRLSAFCPIIDVISEKEAIYNNWISKYDEYNIALHLNDEDRVAYSKYTDKINEILSKYKRDYQKFTIGTEYVFDGDLNLILSGLSGKMINGTHVSGFAIRNMLSKIHKWHVDLNLLIPEERLINDNYHPDIVFNDAKVLQNMVHLRTNILNNNIVKVNACVELSKMQLGKTIIFNESVEMADKLGKLISKSIVFHSYIKAQPIIDINTGEYYRMKSKDQVKLFGKKMLKEMIPNLLMHNLIEFVITARALDEGLNAPCIQTVITTAGSINSNQHKQRSGRAKRIDFDNPFKRVVIINLYFEEFTLPDGTKIVSRDKEKLISRQKFMNIQPVWLKSVEEFIPFINAESNN